MKLWKKMVIGVTAALALGVGANVVAMAAGGDDPAGVVDISGPCDEAEHAGDPRCAGVTVSDSQRENDNGRVDISGPCDEAEHAQDPRCSNVDLDGDDDNSGPSENSGPGNADDDDESKHHEGNSGPGPGGDDSGHGDDD
jgi:hypothetical protein